MARLFADENFPLPVVDALRQYGHDVQTIHMTGAADMAISDRDVLAIASASKRAILTLNRRHFVALHQLGIDHSGIIVCTSDADFAGQAARIHIALEERGDLDQALVRVNRPPK